MKGNINIYLDISWDIEDIEYFVILKYTLYWIYIYRILLLYVCTWICQVYANALDVSMSNLYKNRCCSLVHQKYQLHKHLTIRKKIKCCLLCCKSLGSACACHRLLHSPRCLNENVFIVLSKSERAFVALRFSLCKSLCTRRTAHTAALCECVI